MNENGQGAGILARENAAGAGARGSGLRRRRDQYWLHKSGQSVSRQ